MDLIVVLASRPQQLLAAGEPGSPTFYGILVGIGSYLASQWLHDFIKTAIQKRRLTNALLVDCTVTLNKFDAVIPRLKEMVDRYVNRVENGSAQPCTKVTVNVVRDLVSDFWLSPPLDCSRELIILLPTIAGRDIIHFFDRWSLFFTLQTKFSQLYPALLAEVAKSDEGIANPVADEFWEQAISLLNEMSLTANELCYFSCSIIRRHCAEDDFAVSDLSEGRWNSWAQWSKERDSYSTVAFPNSAV